jgi:hypothetical protein
MPGTTDVTSSTVSVKTTARGVYGWSNAALATALILGGFLPYLNTLFNGFVYDDITQVMNNPYLQSFRYLREIFSTTVWSYIGIL